MTKIKKSIVTGATSFLGQYLVNELTARGCFVYAVIRPNSAKKKIFANNKNVEEIYLDVSDINALTKGNISADYFFHFAWDGIGAKGRNDENIQISNHSNAIKCLRCASELGCSTFIFAGSQAEYGKKDCLISENKTCAPLTLYGKYKYKVCNDATKLSKQLNITYFHLRIFSVYGKGDHEWSLISQCLEKFRKNEPMDLTECTQYWNYLYVKDAARMIVNLADSNAKTGIYNIAGNDTRQLKSYINELQTICNSNSSVNFGAYTPPELPVNLNPDISKVLNEINGFNFTDFTDGISEILN